MSLFLFHLPQLVEGGYIYSVVSPIYKVVDSKKKVLFFFDESSAQRYFKSHSGFEATHIKGLGELNPQELYETTMVPETRHLIQLKTTDIQKTLGLYSELMGQDAASRRDFIQNNKLSDYSEDVFDDDDDVE